MSADLLLVEDDRKRRDMYLQIAQEAGFVHITQATSSDDVHELTTEHSFDVALVDLGLPNLEDGLHVIKHIRQTQPTCWVIAVTGLDRSDDHVTLALKAGAHDFASSKWAYINFAELLVRRLRMWRSLAEDAAQPVSLESE